jgi:acetate kinase
MYTLVLNAGSSSLKFKLFNSDLSTVADGIAEKIGQKTSFIDFNIGKKRDIETGQLKNHKEALKKIFKLLENNKIDLTEITKIGHRVVHGGEEFVKPTKVTSDFLRRIAKYNKLAPLHNPSNLSGIQACQSLLPKATNYAVFDTAFHNTIPAFAHLYPIPMKYYRKNHVRKYGFHGISHQYVSHVASLKLKKKKPNLITCHLGSGCSVTAVREGESVDTSMGFTPLEGLMMMSRAGDIDPAVIFYLIGQGNSAKAVEKMLNFDSGLKGVSGMSDMRDIMIASGYKIPGYNPSKTFVIDNKKAAKLALQMFTYRVKKYIGAYTAVLGKVDAIVFTAGIGERNADIRNLITRDLPNKPKILVIPTNEELMIATQI